MAAMPAKKLVPKTFPGISAKAIAFLRELEAHNERAWFQENKPRFETLWKAPLQALVDDASGKRLVKIFDALEADGWEVGGEELKTAARGQPKDHPRVRFLRHKGLTASRTWTWKKRPPAWLTEPEALRQLGEAWAACAPLNKWLTDNVGPAPAGSRWVRDAP
jgi:uncharacterized protein (DUF2461 family)